ncbi:PPC domain-containing protein [Leptolyngbya sp. FACHB-711]|uniref:PPC domain-containing protein n=1 Tax=unclassified Leptolyngbya TaxID=2650499 RepID=UPI0016853E3C|nr:PPC domain-containing protein [Leptolyngbya sp. FACHB-711]MBD1851884.1 PPC domain-containing protein [Cyanobacteria bacterium FACHB-502]MBD2027246.1 PPC domain-containing protein [Leptolyngbya sp. FACHB-711]
MVRRRSDDTFQGARNLQLNRATGGALGHSDRVDFYKFKASSPINFHLTLNNLQADARVKLLNGRRVSVGVSDQTGFQTEQIITTLEAGTYYIQVRLPGRRGSTRYSLRASSVPAEPGETTAIARNLGILSGDMRLSESVSNSDRLDYYKFTLSQISNINVNIDGVSSPALVSLYFDANNNGLIDNGEQFDSGSDGNTIARTVLPGTYYLQVESLFGSSSQYNLSIAAAPDPSNLPTDPGNTASTAFNLSTFPATARDFVGTFDSSDYYKFTLPQINDINVNINGLSRTTFVNLHFDANNNGLIDSGERLESGSDNDTIARTVLPGTYYLEVDSFGSATRYDLIVEAKPNPGNLPVDPGNRAAIAYDLGTPLENQTIQDFVGAFDELDYYKFKLNTARTLNVNIDGLAATASVTLYFDANNNGLIDSGEWVTSGSDNSTISRVLQTGTYFLEVNTFSNATRYNLNLGVG